MNFNPSMEIRSDRIYLAEGRDQFFSRRSNERLQTTARIRGEIGQDSPQPRADSLTISPSSNQAQVASRRDEPQTHQHNFRETHSESNDSSLQLQFNTQTIRLEQTQFQEDRSSHRSLTGEDQIEQNNIGRNLSQFIHLRSSQTSMNLSPYSSESTETMEPRMEEYISLIRKLSKDKQSAEQIIQQIKSFNIRNQSEQEATSEGMFALTQKAIQQMQTHYSEMIQSGRQTLVERRVSESSLNEFTPPTVQQSDPLVLDLDGNGFDLTPVEEGILFDITGKGEAKQTAFVYGKDAFLAYDRNGNGRIDSGKELFGDQNGAQDGFAELARYDENQDQIIDWKDSIFPHLKLLSEFNRDGLFQAKGLRSLADEGIEALHLNTHHANHFIAGNAIIKTAQFTRHDGTNGHMGDVLLNYIA